jgi:hypothetical protein
MDRRTQATLGATALLALLATSTGLLTEQSVYLPWYTRSVTMLLAVGLFFAAAGIDLEMARRDWRLILKVITIGVFLKAFMIGGIMAVLFNDPFMWVRGIAMAQIDPVGIAALEKNSQMSERTKSFVRAWASLDDPVTTLMTVYAPKVLVALGVLSMPTLVALPNGQALLWNFLLVCGVYGAWRFVEQVLRPPAWLGTALGTVILTTGLLVGSWHFLMIGVAVAGLSVRPMLGWLMEVAPRLAFLGATFFILALAFQGIDILPGLVLGLCTYGAQIVASHLLVRSVPRPDRWRVAFVQISGITAILLALILEPVRPGGIAMVVPAILTVFALYFGVNGWAAGWLRSLDRQEAERAAVAQPA